MTRPDPLILAFLLSVVILPAQQPNSADASLSINNTAGPPYPIQNVQVFGGVPATMLFTGSPGMPIDLGQSSALSIGNQTTPMGILDLDYGNIEILLQGEQIIDGTGQHLITITPPITLPAGLNMSYQASILAPASPGGAVLSAATSITTAVGIVGANLPLGDNSGLYVNFTPHSLQAAFYSQTYNGIYVNSNGHCSFGSANTDFTSTSVEFRAQQPRISAFWADLHPGANTVRWQIDLTQPLPIFSAIYTNVGEAYGAAGHHDFTMTLQLNPTGQPASFGDIRIIHPFNNPPSNYDTITGITPGANVSAAQPQDLSVLLSTGGYFGAANEAIYEFFSGTTSTTGLPGPPFDLTLTTLTFSAQNPGQPDAAYFLF